MAITYKVADDVLGPLKTNIGTNTKKPSIVLTYMKLTWALFSVNVLMC